MNFAQEQLNAETSLLTKIIKTKDKLPLEIYSDFKLSLSLN